MTTRRKIVRRLGLVLGLLTLGTTEDCSSCQRTVDLPPVRSGVVSGDVRGSGGPGLVRSHLAPSESCDGVFSAPTNAERAISGPGPYALVVNTSDEGPGTRCVGVVLTDFDGQRLDSASAVLRLFRGGGLDQVTLDLEYPEAAGER